MKKGERKGSVTLDRSMASFGEAPPGDLKAGEKIFKTKCAQCHTVEKGAGHKQGWSNYTLVMPFLFDAVVIYCSSYVAERLVDQALFSPFFFVDLSFDVVMMCSL